MSDIVNELVKDPIRRDRWGRYLVLNPATGKVEGYTRATTIAKTLDDGGGLLGWGKRMVAIGLSKRADLVALVAGTDDNDRRALDDICERAAEAGGSTIRRDLGIALHAALEDSWGNPAAAPEGFRADVMAVHEALDVAGLGFLPHLSERVVVNDTYKVAGTFDLVLTDGEEFYVADIKTGSSISYGALGFSVQLALYATADALYTQGAAKDGSADVREEMPPLNRNHGVILHVEPYSGKCELHWIDLATGRAALDLAMQVREMRKVKVLSPVEPANLPAFDEEPTQEQAAANVLEAFPGAERVPVVSDEWRAWATKRIAAILAAGHKADLLMGWPTDVPTLKSGTAITGEQGELIAQLLSSVEGKHGLPFADPAPGQTSQPALPAWLKVIDTEAPDEGGKVPREEVARISAEAKALPPEGLAYVKNLQAEAKAAGCPLHLQGPGGRATAKRAAVMEALVLLATKNRPVNAALAQATKSPTSDRPLGEQVGSLSTSEALAFLEAALAA